MLGLVTKRYGYEFRIPDHLVFNLNTNQQKFVVEGSGYLFSFQNLRKDIEYDFLVAEFDEASERISLNNDVAEIDKELVEMMEDENWQLQRELEEFRKLEAILKDEGII